MSLHEPAGEGAVAPAVTAAPSADVGTVFAQYDGAALKEYAEELQPAVAIAVSAARKGLIACTF